MLAALYLAFVASGAAGLVYESIWARYLGLFVGHGAYAQIIVLTIFLGGMAAGALVVGARSAKLREPLLVYAGIELATGLLGMLFHPTFVAVTGFAYEAVFPRLAEGGALVAVKWTIAALLILPQSLLLGATFPLMAAGALRRTRTDPGAVLGTLYFANSLGAAGGVLAAGFLLIDRVGLPGTVLTAALLNVGVGLVAWIVVRLRPTTAEAGDPAGNAPAPSQRKSDPLWVLLLVVSFGTAVASFLYEIAWIRLLSLVLGSATHSFELMLSAFILGLAAGSLWVRRRMASFREPILALGIVQWTMGVLAIATLGVYVWSFELTAWLLGALQKNESGYALFNGFRYALCLLVMYPATFCAGMTLPLISRTLLVAGHGERAIGWVYGTNTLGAIAGAAGGGLVLLPAIGVKAVLLTGGALDIALGVLAIRMAGEGRRFALPAAAFGALAVALLAFLTPLDRTVLMSGVYRKGALPGPGTREVLYYHDGRTATVAVGHDVPGRSLFIATNGKPDAAIGIEWLSPPTGVRIPLAHDEAAEVLLALVTLAHAPQGRAAAVVGHGSGLSSHFLLSAPSYDTVVTIEIEPAMIEGSRHFLPANRRVFEDPRSRFVVDDAKSFFAAESRRYDLILSEPSNPWVSGVSSLFTLEFYERVRARLSDRGVFGQWLHLYENDDTLVSSALAALHRTFASYDVFLLDAGNLLVVASASAELPAADWSIFESAPVAADLARVAPLRPEHLESLRILDREALAPLFDGWAQPNSDFFPVVDLGAERARYLDRTAAGFLGVAADRFDVVAARRAAVRSFGAPVPPPIMPHPRLEGLARGARIREARDRDALAELARDPTVADAAHRLRRWEAASLSGQPPVHWRRWLEETFEIEADLAGGTAGVVDERFFAALHEVLARHEHPTAVADSVRFLEALGRFDFAVAAAAADPLIERALRDDFWTPPALLADGAVVAKLATGDRAGARRVLDGLGRRVRPPDDLRSRLLDAWVGR